MKRRAFVRTATGVLSAAVFTSTGWLMGTRSLTMGASMPPPDPPSGCSVFCASHRNCEINGNCQFSPKCNTVDYYYYSSNLNCDPPGECFIPVFRGICNCSPCIEP